MASTGDFGSATSRFTTRRRLLSLPIAPEGTAEYLSPEQITGGPCDARSDIYGWGIVMYELLTGEVPFTGRDPWAAMAAHLQGAPTPLRSLRPDVSPAVEGIVMTAMRRVREHRYANAAALLADLDRVETLDRAFDLSPEDPITTPVGGAEATAVIRLILVVMAGFLAIAATAIALTVFLG